jgi:hypothetical protein
MNDTPILKLCTIASKQPQQASTFLIVARRICRILSQRRKEIRDESRQFWREAKAMEKYRPFTDRSIRELESRAVEHRAEEGRQMRKVMAAFGHSIIHDRDGIAASLGFDKLCDLLAINAVEREEARRDGITDLASLVFGHVLEESASRRGQERNNAPLFNACQLAFVQFIRDCPSDQLPDPFEPGAPFGPKLPPQLKVVH